MLADKSKNSQQILHDTVIKEKEENFFLISQGKTRENPIRRTRNLFFFLGGGGGGGGVEERERDAVPIIFIIQSFYEKVKSTKVKDRLSICDGRL
jgi:hypothetical protein